MVLIKDPKFAPSETEARPRGPTSRTTTLKYGFHFLVFHLGLIQNGSLKVGLASHILNVLNVMKLSGK